MPKNGDGSVISSFFKTGQAPDGDTIYSQGMAMIVGQIDKIHFIDDASNISKKFVEYDVSVRDEKGGQIVIRNARCMAFLSSTNDFDETVLEPNEYAFSGKLEPANFFVNKNGTTVIMAALNGSKDKPFIIGTLQHPKKLGAKRIDGIRKMGEFRGVSWEVNKDGELIITQRGARSPDGKLKSSVVNSEFKLDKQGNISLSDQESNKLYFDRENRKIVVSQQSTNQIVMERDTPKVSVIVGTGGLKVEIDGAGDKAIITTAGGPKITVDGAGNIKLEANGTLIDIDGNSGKISLTGNLVDVGAGASALAVLGPQLLAWLSSHIHIGDGGPAPGLTSPPVVPPPASLLSTTVKIKP